jgi:hypothetical protein
MTATTLEARILNAFLARAAFMATEGPTLPVAFPDVAFTPPSPPKYLEISHLPNRPFWEGLTDGVIAQGIFQITVHWPLGQGQISPVDMAGQVMAFFPKGTKLFDTGLRISVYGEPWYSQPLTNPQDITVPVSIPYRAYSV